MAFKAKLPTDKQAKLYSKLRKKGFSIKQAEDLMRNPKMAKSFIERM